MPVSGGERMSGLADPKHRWYESLPRILSDLGVGLVLGNHERLLYVNEAFCSLTGYTAEELLAMAGLGGLLPPDARDPILARARRRMAGGAEPRHYETELLHRGGRRVPVEVSADLLEIDGRREVLGMFRDLASHRLVEAELANRARQQQAVAELGRQALVDPDVAALMKAAVHNVARTLDVEYAEVLVLLPPGEALLLRAGVGWRKGCVGRATVGAGLDSQAGFTLAADAPVVVEDLSLETRFGGSALLVDHGVVSGMSIVIGAGRPWGVLGAHTGKRRLFSAEDTQFLQAVAHVLAEAIERAEGDDALRAAHDQERRLRQRLEAYARQAVEGQEVERRHIARELHDEVGQVLTGVMLTLENVERLPAGAQCERLGRARALAGELLHRVRDLSLDLRPAVLDDLGLRPALLELVERFTTQTGVQVALAHSGLDGRLMPDIETAAYRIAQEALTNIARHAGVGRATLSCVLAGGALVVEVTDPGIGFDPDASGAGPGTGLVGTGLVGMEERARATGGRLRVESQPGRGTRVVAELVVSDITSPPP